MSASSLSTIRVSSLPMAMECPASTRRDGIIIDPVSEPATEGTAAHAVMRIIAERDLSDLGSIDVARIASEHNVDADDLRMHAANGLWIWKQIRDSYAGGAGELSLEGMIAGVRVTGHMDIFARAGKQAHGADWKFGRLDRNYYHQMAGYMVLVLLQYPDLDEVSFSICWMRDREIEPYRMTRADADAWTARFEAEVVHWDEKTFRPGRNCSYCVRSHDCPALVAAARRDISIIAEDPDLVSSIRDGLRDLSPADIVSLYRRSKMIASFCESLQGAVRSLVDRDGPLTDGCGAELRFVPTNGARVLDPLRAWPVIEARLTPEEIAQAVKLRAAVLDQIVAGKAAKGKGAQARRDLDAALEAAGAISRVSGRQFRDQRVK